jgi:fucose 4-O-acetylase-like acetyltransferase
MNYNKNSKVKRRNVGLELLRALLCFWVIIFHFLISTNNIASSVKRKRYHVPCFFFISFFYLYPAIKDKNIAKMKLRLQRLLIPYLIWPFIIFIINNALFLLFKNNQFHSYLFLYDLKIQLLLGRKFMSHLWFMFHLLFFSIFFFILSFLFNIDIFLFCSTMIMILSYAIQYSGCNYNFFIKYKGSIKHSLGYFVESLPFAVSAFFFSSFNAIKYLKIHRIKTLITCIMILYLLIKYQIFADLDGFGYRGIDKNLVSILLFNIIFKIKPNRNS